MFYIDKEYNSELIADFGKLIPFSTDWYDVLPSFFIYKLKQLPVSGLFSVTMEYQYRPDNISYAIYGHVQYKQVIMEYNSIISHLDIVTGLTLSYPSITAIEDLIFSLSSKV